MPLICEAHQIAPSQDFPPAPSPFARRQSQQSSIAKAVMTSNGKHIEQSRRPSDNASVASLRSTLDQTLSNGQHLHNHPSHDDTTMRPPSAPRQSSPPPPHHPLPNGRAATMAMNDTPATSAPNSPRLSEHSDPSTNFHPLTLSSIPFRQNSGTSTPRVRPTTLDIPGLTKSKVSPDGRIASRDVGAKLVIVMVGLPARGKSYITKKLARYLNWLQHDCKIFNVGERRRVAAGGPNTLEKTFSQHSKHSNSSVSTASPKEHRSSLTDISGIIDQNKRFGGNSIAAQIMLNGETQLEAPGTPAHTTTSNTSIRLPDPNAIPDDETAVTDDLLSDLPDLAKVSTPDIEQMDQSAAFFDPANKRAALIREQCAMDTLDELLDYILDGNGSVGILDATNSTLERRKIIMKKVRERAGAELNVMFLESRCIDEQLLESNMRLKLSGPDYKDKDPVAALEDFKRRVVIYEKNYVPLGEFEEKNNLPYIQMVDVGRKIISHQIKGFLMAQANYYLLNFNLAPRQIWITRHGLSQDNISGIIGGDCDLSAEGDRYARSLTRFMSHQRQEWDMKQLYKTQNSHFPPQPGDTTPPNPHYQPNADNELPQKAFCVWTSMLKRSVQTAKYFDEEEYDCKQMRMLNELNAGLMEGLSYSSIAKAYPVEYQLRKQDKLHYRYPGPGGEGYLDIINRVRQVIVELERMEDHVLLIGHRSVARVLLAYFRGLRREEVAELDVPIGMLYCLEPKPYGVEFKAYKWDRETEWFYEQPDFQLKAAKDDMQS